MSDKKQFTILGKGYFRDNEVYTTLEGQQYQNEFLVIKENVKPDAAKRAVEECTEHGGGWEQPMPRAFLACIDYKDPKDARHQELKEVLPLDWVWMKEPFASYSDYAWYVSLDLGNVSVSYRGGRGLAVGCRRVSPSQ